MATTTSQTEKKDPGNLDALLERAPELESWHGIVLDHPTAQYDRRERELTVFCELRPAEGPKLKHNTQFVVVIYDQNDRILARDNALISKDNFYGFEVMSLSFFDLAPKKVNAIKKIKIYPAKW